MTTLEKILELMEELISDRRLIQHFDNPNGPDKLECLVCYGNLYNKGHFHDCLYGEIPQMIEGLKEIIEKNGKIANALSLDE